MENKTNHKQFSLFDFFKKKSDKIHVFGKETIGEDGNVIPFVDQAALVTHYLQLRDSDVKIPYERQAEDILNLWHEFAKGEEVPKPDDFDCVADSAIGYESYLLQDIFKVPFKAPEKPKFKFIDLFAGIGGFRMAFQNLGGECVFSSEWDEQAKKTYYY